jgi:hypothetical protein
MGYHIVVDSMDRFHISSSHIISVQLSFIFQAHCFILFYLESESHNAAAGDPISISWIMTAEFTGMINWKLY